MNQGPIERPTRAAKRLPWRIPLAIAVAVIFVSVGYYLMVQDSVVELTMTDGSFTSTIQGDFLETSPDNAIYSYLNATTYAERTGRPVSVLTMQIVAATYWLPDYIHTGILVRVVGILDSGLNAQSLEIVFNQTASSLTTVDYISFLYGVNISYEQQDPYPYISGDGSGSLKVELVNRTTADYVYEFSLRNNVLIEANGEDKLADRSMSFRAIVSGDFEPEFSVSISIVFVDTSGAS